MNTMRMKRMLSIVLAFVMVMSLLVGMTPLTASAATEITSLEIPSSVTIPKFEPDSSTDDYEALVGEDLFFATALDNNCPYEYATIWAAVVSGSGDWQEIVYYPDWFEEGETSNPYGTVEHTLNDYYLVIIAYAKNGYIFADAEDITVPEGGKLLFVDDNGGEAIFAVPISPLTKEKINSFRVDIDYKKIPTLKEGMTVENFYPKEYGGKGDACFEKNPANVTGSVKLGEGYGWALKLDESFKINEEEAKEIYKNLGVNEENEEYKKVKELIEEYNENVAGAITESNGWVQLDYFLSATSELGFYKINKNDTYALWITVEPEAGKEFAGPDGKGNFPGTIDGNVEVASSIYNYDNDLILFYNVGTLAEIEAEKNGEPTTPPTETPTTPPTETPKTEAPKTGDTNSVLPMVALMAVAGAAMVVANKKREEEK